MDHVKIYMQVKVNSEFNKQPMKGPQDWSNVSTCGYYEGIWQQHFELVEGDHLKT